jgi:hypothetical protein
MIKLYTMAWISVAWGALVVMDALRERTIENGRESRSAREWERECAGTREIEREWERVRERERENERE